MAAREVLVLQVRVRLLAPQSSFRAAAGDADARLRAA